MKKYKFIAWDKEENRIIPFAEIVERSVIYDFLDEYIDPFHEMTGRYKSSRIYMQYTGRADKKGREIYDGHILHAKGHYPGEGWYDTGEHDYNFVAEVKYDEEYQSYRCGGYYLHELEDIEIIGNIYQNPELLN